MARVLLLEDMLIIGELVAEMVEEAGHEVMSICASAEEGREVLEGQRPDLLLLDVGIGGEFGGIQFLRRAREGGYTGKAVFLSAYPESTIAPLLRGVEYDAYLLKPADQETLARTLDGILVK